MKKIRMLLSLALVAALLCALLPGAAETALVVTPKGPLNVRKTPDKQAKVVGTLPNHSQVEVDSVDGDWAVITFKDRTAYVMTQFLRLPSALAGQTVYADSGALVLLREAPAADAKAVYPLGGLDAVTVEKIEDGWLEVTLGSLTAYVEAEAFSLQLTEPVDAPAWINEPGVAVNPCDVTLDSQTVTRLEPGDPVTVTLISADQCLVVSEDGCGYAPVSAIYLLGPEEDSGVVGKISPMTAYNKAVSVLKKAYKGFANQYLRAATRVYGEGAPLYHCGFFNEQGQYVYGALVDANSGKVVYRARYNAFAQEEYVPVTPEPATAEPTARPTPIAPTPAQVPPTPAAPTPAPTEKAAPVIELIIPGSDPATEAPATDAPVTEAPVTEAPATDAPVTEAPATDAPATETPATDAPATEAPATDAPATEAPAEPTPTPEVSTEINLYISDDVITLGDVLDIIVEAWTTHACQYTIYNEKGVVAQSEAGPHFTAAYRPAAAGEYLIKVVVDDENGLSDSLMIGFHVEDAETAGILYDLYSQKDGWWAADDMEKYGSFIFALTHALEALGVEDAGMLPENLAVSYVMALVPGLSDFGPIMQEVTAAFDLATQEEIIQDAAKLRELLGKDACFIFSPVDGHSALICGVSEDGDMVRVIDSAPGVTFHALEGQQMYFQQEDGSFQPAQSLEENPEARWYIETDDYGALEYWLKLDYAASRGGWLMQKKE